MFFSGQRPALNVGISVSRVGGNAQTKAMKQVAGKIKLELAQYRDLAAFAQFGSDLDKVTQAQLNRGARLMEIMKQGQNVPVVLELQVVLFWSAINGYLDKIPVKKVQKFEKELYTFFQNSHDEVLKEIVEKKKIDKDLEDKIRKAVEEFATIFQSE